MKMSKEWGNRSRNYWLGKKHSKETRKKMRLTRIRQIEKQKLNGEPLIPCIGGIERDFLNQIEKILEIKIQRQFSICGYYLDGFIPELKLAFEFDEIQNHQNTDKDLHRQEEIEEALDCRFFRITDKEWENNKEQILNKIRRIKNDIG